MRGSARERRERGHSARWSCGRFCCRAAVEVPAPCRRIPISGRGFRESRAGQNEKPQGHRCVRADNCASLSWDVFGGRFRSSTSHKMPVVSASRMASPNRASSSELRKRSRRCSRKASIREAGLCPRKTARIWPRSGRSNHVFHNPICRHRLGLADQPMHFCDVGCGVTLSSFMLPITGTAACEDRFRS